MSAKSRWDKLNSLRSSVLQRARDCAALTIPSLAPPEGSDESAELPTPYQSLGARGVNNLASKFLLSLFPPGTSFFRFGIEDSVAAALGASKDKVDEAMRKLENRGMKRFETAKTRAVLYEAIRHLIATGNSLVYMPIKGDARCFRLSQYVVVRDASGNVTEIVIKESVNPTTLPEATLAACEITVDDKSDGKDVDIYTHVKLTPGGVFAYHQEINDKTVPSSQGRIAKDNSPFIVLRWSATPNESYGRGYVEEYLGDLRSMESLSESIVGFSAIASRVVIMVKPNASTDEDDITKAENGDVITGDAEDVSVLQLEKYADFQVAKAVIDDLNLRLSHAFLLQSGTVRNAERVTAEEIRALAQELEDALGGVYSVQAQEFQLPVIRRVIVQMRDAKEFPEIPKVNGKDAISPVVITGFEALGRGHELNRFRAYVNDGVAIFGDTFRALFDPIKAAQKLATQHNVDVTGIVKTPEELAAAQNQSTMAELASKAAGPVAGALAKGAVQQ